MDTTTTASSSAIEVNGTYYSTFKPPTFAKWYSETPEGFMFSLKANRFATNRRVLDVWHRSFATPDFLALARQYGCVPVHTDSGKFPAIADFQADFAYLPLMRSQADVPTVYTPEAIARWAQGVRAWTSGERPRDVFVYFINGAKERAPAVAMALMAQLGQQISH